LLMFLVDAAQEAACRGHLYSSSAVPAACYVTGWLVVFDMSNHSARYMTHLCMLFSCRRRTLPVKTWWHCSPSALSSSTGPSAGEVCHSLFRCNITQTFKFHSVILRRQLASSMA
jgi:hypothetical protein